MTGRRPQRNWRLRGRRGQVSAVATLLGLLLVVTFIANYLTTQLPNQMQANDLSHEITVQNQIGHFDALLQAVSSAHAIGAEVTTPLSLGSDGEPPFAAPDTSYLSAPQNGTWAYLNYTTTGTGGNTVVTTPVGLGQGLVAHLVNTYAPGAEVALVQGAVVYAELAANPIFSDPPAITAVASSSAVTALHIWIPEFVGSIPGTSGAMTANLVARLLSTNVVVVSSDTHLTIAAGTSLTLTLTSQYAFAWYQYFLSQQWPGVTTTCAGFPGTTSTVTACSSTYQAIGTLGKVTVTIPGGSLALLSVTVAVFSIGVQ
ncbi:MAG TPA: hypothetical protein VMI55_07355 [Thermoplasmata archaeon]|nr:hypothetical protein [Thermoplasmata archaeon]